MKKEQVINGVSIEESIYELDTYTVTDKYGSNVSLTTEEIKALYHKVELMNLSKRKTV
ncbi:hypothetical protein WKH56_20350 [Priestia sp. SB1]|uniref:hypothetical protein n=1 Tax=Priestia sp. SB1 TaxID=3132359 RepID=UPI00316D0CCC